MVDIAHEIKVHAPPQKIRQALSTQSDLEAWHGGRVTSTDGELRFDFADGTPTFRWAVQPGASADEITWRCLQGPGDSVGTAVTFRISPADKGRTLIECTHTGWPHTGGNYRKCNTLWGVLLHHLRQFLETGQHGPALRAPT
jgi:hypothetical protein